MNSLVLFGSLLPPLPLLVLLRRRRRRSLLLLLLQAEPDVDRLALGERPGRRGQRRPQVLQVNSTLLMGQSL